ncbi:uncharacterized protein PG986_013857 [Apiospora aurea]|uniref:Uncharacterized protein n=1 Tax=Apiospora aurea TaxID=335848 RepID=A0ABR1PWT6_9PEZI
MVSKPLLTCVFMLWATSVTAAPLTNAEPEHSPAMAVRAALVARDDQAGYLVPGKQAPTAAVVSVRFPTRYSYASPIIDPVPGVPGPAKPPHGTL